MFAGMMILAPGLQVQEIVEPRAWHRALSPYRCADAEAAWESGPAMLVQARVFNTPESHAEILPCVCPESGVAVTFWGRLDNRENLAARLNLEPSLADSQIVLAAWRRWGEALPEQLLGDFSLVVLDPVHRQVFIARDPFGAKPLYYRLNNKALIFATTLAAFRVLKTGSPAPDKDWMGRFLVNLSQHDNRQTCFDDVVKLPPGHCLTVGSDGKEQLRRWFVWRDDPPAAKRRDPRWVDEYRAALEQAIRCRMRSSYPLGTENSGGIDSAAITAYLAHFLGEPGDRLHSFGLALCEQEPAFILETSQQRRIVHNYILTALPERGDDDIERVLTVLGHPEEYRMGSAHLPFYRECELRDVRTLFSGFGGDEAVTNPGHHLRYELLNAGQYAQLWNILPGNPLMRTLRLAKAITINHDPQPYSSLYIDAWKNKRPHLLLRDELLQRLNIDDLYLETARYDAPYRRINDFVLNSLAPYVTNRLENCTLIAASFGVEYSWPLLDVRLVQQYLSTPSIEKFGPQGMGRYLHRCAINRIVSSRIAWKPTKDMGSDRLARERNSTAGLQSVIKQAQRQAAHLHPALEELIDIKKLCGQIERVTRGEVDQWIANTFRKNVEALRLLNHWLHGGPVD